MLTVYFNKKKRELLLVLNSSINGQRKVADIAIAQLYIFWLASAINICHIG